MAWTGAVLAARSYGEVLFGLQALGRGILHGRAGPGACANARNPGETTFTPLAASTA